MCVLLHVHCVLFATQYATREAQERRLAHVCEGKTKGTVEVQSLLAAPPSITVSSRCIQACMYRCTAACLRKHHFSAPTLQDLYACDKTILICMSVRMYYNLHVCELHVCLKCSLEWIERLHFQPCSIQRDFVTALIVWIEMLRFSIFKSHHTMSLTSREGV